MVAAVVARRNERPRKLQDDVQRVSDALLLCIIMQWRYSCLPVFTSYRNILMVFHQCVCACDISIRCIIIYIIIIIISQMMVTIKLSVQCSRRKRRRDAGGFFFDRLLFCVATVSR